MLLASAIIGGITAATGAGIGIYGSVKAAREQKKADAAFAAAKSEEEQWFNKEYYKDWTERAEVQQALRLAADEQKKQQTRAAAQAEIGGATDEAKLAAQESANKSYSDTVAQIASNLSQLRDNTLNNYRTRMAALNQQGIQRYENNSNQYTNLATNGFNTMASGVGTMISGIYGYQNGVGLGKTTTSTTNS